MKKRIVHNSHPLRVSAEGVGLPAESFVDVPLTWTNSLKWRYNTRMSVATEKIAGAIRKFPVRELVSMHEHLMATIQHRADAEGLDPAFRDEIAQRVIEIEDGTAKGDGRIRALKKM